MEVVATQSVMTVEWNGIMEIIGLSGYARSGKDEAARVLVEEFGFVQVAFADKLREMLYQLNPIVDVQDVEIKMRSGDSVKTLMLDEFTPSTLRAPIHLQEVIDEYGWGGYKETVYGDEIRRLLQRLGTEAGRQTLWDTIWIDAALSNLPDDAKVVVSDARFFNEFDAVRDRGGVIWRIERNGVGPANDHASETAAAGYSHFSLYLKNDGTLEEFREAVAESYTKGK